MKKIENPILMKLLDLEDQGDIDFDQFDLSVLEPHEQKEFRVLLAEMMNRGLDVPMEKVDKKLVVFPRDNNGYFIKRDGTKFTPNSEDQKSFISSSGIFTLFYGGRGSGKTAGGAQKALDKIAQGEPGTIINPIFEDFKDSTWAEFREWIPPEMVVPKHRYRLFEEWEPQRPFRLVFTNGARVICKGLKNPKSARGPNNNWLWYDEGGSDPTGEGWRIAIASVRIGKDPQSWVTSTPNGVLQWLYTFFMDKDHREDVERIISEFRDVFGDRTLIESFHGTIDDNKKNLDPVFYASMLAAYSDEWEKNQEIEGLFVQQGRTLGQQSWFDGRKLDNISEGIRISKRIRYWDLAATEKKIVAGKKLNDPDKTVGTLLAYSSRKDNEYESGNRLDQLPYYKGGDVFFIEDQVGDHWEYVDILKNMWNVALEDGFLIPIRIEQEPGAGGINQIAAIRLHFEDQCRKLGMPMFDFSEHRPEGDKVQRANIWFKEAKEGAFYIIKGLWNVMFFRILNSFGLPNVHDDEVDSVSGARWCIKPVKMWKRIPFRSLSGKL
jgi:phage terminase large subunit-like protein